MSTKRRTLGVHSQPRPLGPNGEKLCFNCRGPLPKGRAYNCSSKCSEEWSYKTSPGIMRQAVWNRDKGVCANCGFDTKLSAEYNRARGTGHLWQADHIKPVIEGGGECTLENLRTLCTACHKKATAELHGRLADQRKEAKANAALEVLKQPLQFGNLAQKVAARTLAKLQSANVKSLKPSSTDEKSTNV
jgi:5-methylcytosine-specific restriction enzyme A